MHGNPAGMRGAIASQPSSLPMKSSFASLCSRIWRTGPAARVAYNGTGTWPAIQAATSHISQCAIFFDRMAMRVPAAKFKPARCAA